MNAKPTFTTDRPLPTLLAAAAAAFIAVGLFWGVFNLFRSQGTPMEQLAAAERGCAHCAYRSEREACMKQWLARAQAAEVARR